MGNYDKTKKFFSENAEKYAKSSSHAKDDDLEMLIDHIKPEKHMITLDAATGSGFTAVAIARMVKKVYAMDMVNEMLDETKKLAMSNNIGNLETVNGYAENIPFPDNTFDIVTCRRAAHHFSDKDKFISEAFRVLKPGGVIGIDDMTVSTKYINTFNDLERLRDNSHMEAASLEQWNSIISNAGFEVIYNEIYKKRVTYSQWIYPVNENSEESVKSLNYLKNSDKEYLSYIEWDGNSFVKRWLVTVAKKQNF